MSKVAGVGHVRTTAHIRVFLVVVKLDGFAFRNLLDNLYFVRFVSRLKCLFGLKTINNFNIDIIVFCNQLLHSSFNCI